MKPKEIQELIDYIAKSGLDEVNIETEQFKISVKRSATSKTPETQFVPVIQTPINVPIVQPSNQIVTNQLPVNQIVTNPPTNPPISESANYVTLKSPMIGTFYRASSPDTPAFVEVGSEVRKGQILCVIEAMKLFNEIEAEYSGKIVKILNENATPVEYDQALFVIDPS
ncbi:MAG: acetyl-CoA carboxylase biotin carboxyl carrier protein [Verrucomicrobia bacterium]|nr:acetyl-CoA carboxylase biotin carboxyl carrier protein [Cytophagales bacterium]